VTVGECADLRLLEGCQFITAYNDENARQQALRAGAVGYLVKPFEEADLLNGINLALQR
jgi:CheY-like chemotaxis protein